MRLSGVQEMLGVSSGRTKGGAEMYVSGLNSWTACCPSAGEQDFFTGFSMSQDVREGSRRDVLEAILWQAMR